MSVFDFLNSVCRAVVSVVCDDNGHPYREDDGGWIPNNEFDLDGSHYETDDYGSIYRVDGEYFPEDIFELDGEVYTTDENGKVNTK